MPDTRRRRGLLTLLITAGLLAVAVAAVSVWMVTRPIDTARATTPTPTAPSNASPPAPAASPSASASAPADAAAAREIVLGAGGFEIIAADDSSLGTFSWREEPSEAIAALTTAFGSDPVLSTVEGDSHFPEYTVHSWGGFAFSTMVEDLVTREEHGLPSFITLTDRPTSDDVVVRAEFGLSPGMSADEVRALGPDSQEPLGLDGEDGIRFIFGVDRDSNGATNGGTPGAPDRWVVIADTGADGTTVETIRYSAYIQM